MAPSIPPMAFVHSNSLSLVPTLTRASSITAMAHEQTQKESDYPQIGHCKGVSIILVCLLGFVVSNMSQQAMYVIQPMIQRDLDIDAADLQWLSSGFTLGYGSCLLLAGRMADIYGHKRFLLIGLVIFAAFSLANAFARSLHQLALFRACQGLGAAAISSSLIAILGRTFAHGTKMRTEAFATFSAGSPLGSSLGLFAGGFKVSNTALGWRAFFYLSLAVSTLAAILAFFVIPPDPPRSPAKTIKKIDWVGAVMVVLGLNMLVSTLAISTHYTWRSPIVLTPFIISLLLLGGFFLWEYNLERHGPGIPLIRMSLFKNKCYAPVHCIAGLLWVAYSNQNYFLNQYFQNYLDLSVNQTLVRFLPILPVAISLSLVTGYFADRWSAQLIMILGCFAVAVSALLTSIRDTEASYWSYTFVSIALSVAGADFVFTVGAMFALKFAEEDDLAVAGAMFLTYTQVFCSIGLSLSTIAQVKVTQNRSLAFGITVGSYIGKAPPRAYLVGLRAAFWICFASATFASMLALSCLGDMGHVGAKRFDQDPTLPLPKLDLKRIEDLEEVPRLTP